jgi:hypothetical protein
MPRWVKIVSVLIGAAMVIGALYRSNDAANTARHLATQRNNDALVARARDYKRAIASCDSSKQLRALWKRVDELLIPHPEQEDAALQQTHAAIMAYVAANPNCQNLPPKPQGAS